METTILHVDDDPAILRMVETELAKRGYRVVSVIDPKCAIKVLEEISAKIVLLDIDMPDKDGLDLLKEIKKVDASVQVLMLTCMVSMGTTLLAKKLGADECLFKPIQNFDDLGDVVDRAYARRMKFENTLSTDIHTMPASSGVIDQPRMSVTPS